MLTKQLTEEEQTNAYWSSMMAAQTLRASDFCMKAEPVIQSITPQEVSAFVNQVMQQQNYRVLVMMPEGK